MPERPCGLVDCPIVDPIDIDRRRLRTFIWPAGTERFRGVRIGHDAVSFVPEGLGNGRFSPLFDRRHIYMAEQQSAAILESVMHEANGPNPRIYGAQLTGHNVARVRFDAEVRLVDLRDDALADLGLEPFQLTDALPMHYPCTREVATHVVGTKSTQGLIWTSRQGRLHHERNPDGLAAEVLAHRRLDVAVLYQPGLEGSLTSLGQEPLVHAGQPTRFVQELASLLRVAIL